MSDASDVWSRWLLHERFGESEEAFRRGMDFLGPVRDRVLDGAQIAAGDTVLDVGCGDGLLAFGALDRTAPTGRVIFSDVSDELLARCRDLAARSGQSTRCDFVSAALPDLPGVADQVADAVVMRSVLIYVTDKQTAVHHLRRVLKPGGRLSLFEPINTFEFPEPAGWLWGFDVCGLEHLAERVLAVERQYQSDDECPMLGFDERDLLAWVDQAGFDDIRLAYEARISHTHPSAGLSLTAFLQAAPNPLVPTREHVLEEALEPTDRDRLGQAMAEQLSAGSGRTREAMVFLTASRN